MLDLCSWIFIYVFGGTFVFSFLYSCIKSYISKEYFNQRCLSQYESDIKKYDFLLDDSMEDIAKKVHKRIEYREMKAEAFIEKEHPDIIYVNSKLSEKRRNFAITHELGHYLRGYEYQAARNKKKIFSKISPEEQICDYYAAAILLPIVDLKKKMDEVRFYDLNKESKVRFVKEIAQQKCIMEDVVYRRINEIKCLNV